MRKLLFFILLLFFLQINVYANDDLLELAVNGKSVSCSGYECDIEIDSKDAKITYKLGENVKSASPVSGHTVSFDNEHSVKIEVTYNDDSVANYTLTIKKHVKSSDVSLKQLIINEEEVILKEDVFVYSYEAKFDDEIIKVNGTTNDSNASCKEMEYEFSIDKSSLSIEYPITAENGDVRNYTIILKRKNKPDTSLKTLTFSGIDFAFNPKQFDYEITIPYSINTTEISAIANDSKAEVSINKNEFLVVGENIITITVTNDKASDTYAFRIIRTENFDEALANLKTLKVNGYNFKFDPNILEYNLVYKDIPSSIKINAVALDETAVVSIHNNENLQDGSEVLVKVTLENGVVRTYKLNIVKEKEKVVEEEREYSKVLIIILTIILIIVIIILFIL